MTAAARRRWASAAVLAALVVLGAWYVRAHLDAFRRIARIDAASFLELSALCALAILVSGLQINTLVSVFDTRITVWEGFGLSAVNTMANFYFTKAGMAAKGVYLKRRHGFPYTAFLSTVAGSYVVALMTQGVMGLALYAAVAPRIEPSFVLVFLALVAGGALPLAAPRLGGRLERWLPARAVRVVHGWEEVRRHRRALAVIALLNAAYAVVGGFRLYVAYRALGYDVGVVPCLVISTLMMVTLVFSVTPGAVGVRQAIVGYGSETLGIGSTQGVVVSTLDHAVGTLWVFVFGLAFSAWVWARLHRGAGGGAP